MLNLIIKPVWILAENEIQDTIGHEQYGMYAALLSLGYLLLVVSDLGVNQYLTKTLAGKPEQLQSLFPNVLALKLIFSVVYPFFMTGIGFMLGYSYQDLYFLFLLSVVQALIQLGMLFRSKFQAFQYFAVDSVASVIERVVLLGVVFVTFSSMTLGVFIWDRVLAAVINLAIILVIAYKLFGQIRMGFNLPGYKQIIKGSLPFGMIAVLFSIHDKIDQVFLERMIGAKATGIYAAAYRWVDAVMMYLWIILPVLFARFAFIHEDKEEKKKLLEFGQVISAIPIVMVCGFIFVYGEKLFWLFDHSNTTDLVQMTHCLKILFVAVLLNGFMAIYGTMLSATGHEGYINRMMIVSVMMNIVLNIFLVPSLHEKGAAIATVVSTLFMNLAYVVFAFMKKEVTVPYRKLFGIIAGAVIFTATLFLFDYYWKWHWLYNTGISIILYMIFNIVAGVLSLKDLKSLLGRSA